MMSHSSSKPWLRFSSLSLIVLGLVMLGLAAAYGAYAVVSWAQLGNMVTGGPVPYSTGTAGSPVGTLPPAERIIIPTIGTRPMWPWLTVSAGISGGRGTSSAGHQMWSLETRVGYTSQQPSYEIDSKVIEIGFSYENGELVWERPVQAVGHIRGTANPGEASNVVMAGHLSSYIRGEGDVFHKLPEVKPGDEVWLYSAAGKFIYQVVKRDIVAPDNVEVMAPTTEPTLTLITSIATASSLRRGWSRPRS